jgi:hypothetical protein
MAVLQEISLGNGGCKPTTSECGNAAYGRQAGGAPWKVEHANHSNFIVF